VSVLHRMGILTCTVALTAALMATAAPVRAQEDGRVPPLGDRQTQIQRDVRGGERGSRAPGAVLTQTPGVPPASNAALARTDVRLGSLEDDMRSLTGRLEQLGYDIRQLSDRMDKVMSDLEFRLRRLEEQAGVATAPASGAPAEAEPSLRQTAPVLGGAPARNEGESAGEPTGARGGTRAGAGPEDGPGVLATVPRSELEAGAAELRRAVPESVPETGSQSQGANAGLSGGTPQEQYAHAFGLLRASQYDQAEQALKSFLLRNPDNPLSDNARYWLGETYYVRGQYPEAAQQFVDAYEKNRSGPKSADVLLKLGMSLSQLGKREEACATFRELSRTQPDAPETVRDKVAEEARRTGCT
jgi:tol-pal system protein YbgF